MPSSTTGRDTCAGSGCSRPERWSPARIASGSCCVGVASLSSGWRSCSAGVLLATRVLLQAGGIGERWDGPAYAIASGTFGWAAILAILGMASQHLRRPSRALGYLNTAILPIYVLHQTVLIALAVALFPATPAAVARGVRDRDRHAGHQPGDLRARDPALVGAAVPVRAQASPARGSPTLRGCPGSSFDRVLIAAMAAARPFVIQCSLMDRAKRFEPGLLANAVRTMEPLGLQVKILRPEARHRDARAEATIGLRFGGRQVRYLAVRPEIDPDGPLRLVAQMPAGDRDRQPSLLTAFSAARSRPRRPDNQGCALARSRPRPHPTSWPTRS